MKYYQPQAHSFGPVPSNDEGENSSNMAPLGQSASDVLHRSLTVSSANNSQANRNLRPKRTAQHLDLEGASENPSAMTPEPNENPPAVGRGRILGPHTLTARRGKGRAATHGDITPIPNIIREKSLAETRLKRARHDGDESLDEEEEINVGDQRTGVTTASASKRGKFSCDQCFYRKIKVFDTRCYRSLLNL